MANRTNPNTVNAAASIAPLLGIAAVLLSFIAGGIVAYMNTRTLSENAELVTHTHEVLSGLDNVLSLLKDAETGQRGFVVTGDERYLEPYNVATKGIDDQINQIEQLIRDNREQLAQLPDLKAGVASKMQELAETVALRRTDGFEASRAVVMSDRGRETMARIRAKIDTMQHIERALRTRRIEEMTRAYHVAVTSGVITTLIGVTLSGIVGYLWLQSTRNRTRQEWLQSGQIELSKAMGGDQSYEQLGNSVLQFIAEYLNAHVGAFFVGDGTGFRNVATYGTPVEQGVPERFEIGDGLIGQAARDQRTFIISDIPENYLTFASSLGRGRPQHLVIVPIVHEQRTNAIMEFGLNGTIDGRVKKFFDRITESIGPAVKSVEYRSNLQDFLEETQRQAEELQAQGEELRVSNEELEEQSRALRESQARLENQQTELEQINSNLEEQTQLLEIERDSVTRTKTALELQAQELERASRYKSDFLANMSHELRTPLNSSLILAKLLADNLAGNLTPEQVEFAETIRTAGNDLLTLINDILDLSKIEAGHLEIHSEEVDLANIVEDLNRTFRPVASQKKLEFVTHIAPGCPATIETDRQRLEQILKNLLSNGLKFTEAGVVELAVSLTAEGRVAFSVKDTGIGIPEHQQAVIFEAFRQADGTTNRKYGGTGLGLSISRELIRLLSGEISLESAPGKGSTFTVTIPEIYDADLVRERKSYIEQGGALTSKTNAQRTPSSQITAPAASPVAYTGDDDRSRLASGNRAILIVEDDNAFAKILMDLAHESNFQCLRCVTADEGFNLAVQYLPSAVLLDVGLPDHSGLWVLDRLKHDRRTQHIPVHVISANDYARTAYSLGAIGYIMKPVKREELVEALQGLEARLSHRLGRVLIVEDDVIQRESLQKLLRSQDVETVGAASASECLTQLKENTFDCMVLDLTLPDASGYSLLETLSREDTYAFPPVIVYTGHELSSDEEQRLRKYSKSIIIKGAKSPERLLDEVTLFLHRVVSDLPLEQQRMLEKARSRDAAIEGRRILVVEDDVRNVFALTNILEPRGAIVQIARNGREALDALDKSLQLPSDAIDLVLMDVMMPEMDGITATREIRKRPEWKKLPVLILTAKAMKDDQENCLAAGANDYMAKPLDVDKLLSLVRVWMPR